MIRRAENQYGFTLIEVVVTIIILAIVAGVAMRQMGATISTAQYEQTKLEMDALAQAMVGNPMAYSSGSRTDFGYVGDVGALPPNLDALVQNPGGYSTWHGPYVSRGKNDTDFKLDGWGVGYLYQDTLIRSTGSGSSIDKIFAGGKADLLQNVVEGIIFDAKMTPPGGMADSLLVQLIYPNGTGGMTTATVVPQESGRFSLTGVPIGAHQIRIIYQPDNDTLSMAVSVYPKKTTSFEVVFPSDLW